MGACCSSVKQSKTEDKTALSDQEVNEKQKESKNQPREYSQKDDQLCPENQEKNPQKSKPCRKISRNDFSEDKKFLTAQLSRKKRSHSSSDVETPKSLDEELINKKINNLAVSQSFNKQEQEEQNKTIFGNVSKSNVGNSSHNGGENQPQTRQSSSLPSQPVIRDITDFMDVHTLYSSLLSNNACLERMLRRVDVAMETLSKSMRYAKRRQRSFVGHSDNRTSKNESPRKTKPNGTGMRQANSATFGRRERRSCPGRVDGTSGSQLPGKPRTCWQ